MPRWLEILDAIKELRKTKPNEIEGGPRAGCAGAAVPRIIARDDRPSPSEAPGFTSLGGFTRCLIQFGDQATNSA